MDRRLVITGLAGAGASLMWSEAQAAIGDKQAQAALRQLLDAGTVAATTRLGVNDGYWADDKVRIPLPKTLANAQKTAKLIGMSGAFDDLHLAINRGAETAAPLAKALFHDAIASMTIKNAVSIITGKSTAGTEYLKTTTTPRLTTAFTPIIEDALQSAGAVTWLNDVVERNKLKGLLKTDAKTWLGKYTVTYALNGLFHYIGVEETAIRRSPAKRGSQLLKSVFA